MRPHGRESWNKDVSDPVVHLFICNLLLSDWTDMVIVWHLERVAENILESVHVVIDLRSQCRYSNLYIALHCRMLFIHLLPNNNTV